MKLRMKTLIMSALTGAMIIGGSISMAANYQHGNMMSTQHNATVNRDSNVTNYVQEQNQAMGTMMKDMNTITPSGNASIDFLEGMIPHHQAAIDMSKSLLKYGGQNKDVKQIAEDVIRVQTQEIQQMKVMIREMKNDRSNTAVANRYLKEYTAMLNNSSHSMSSATQAQSVDTEFITGMIAHHEMAIEMSKTILKYTNSDKIKTMAQNIITVQNREIEHMKSLLNTASIK